MNRARRAMLALIAAFGINGQAVAIELPRINDQSAVNNCQAALTSFEGAFRKRPLGIANISDSPAFVSCGLLGTADGVNEANITFVVATFTNRGVTPANVSCTLLTSAPGAPGAQGIVLPKSSMVDAGRSDVLQWSINDAGRALSSSPGISCAIPPGVEINGTQTAYTINFGA